MRVNAWEAITEKYLISSPTLSLLELYVFSNFDVSIIYNLSSIMFVTVTADFSLATYLPLAFNPFKQGIAIK